MLQKKRTKNYESKLEQINEINEKLTLENEEIKGKLNTLDEINSKIKYVEDHDQEMDDYNKAKSSLDELTQLVLEQKKDINKQEDQKSSPEINMMKDNMHLFSFSLLKSKSKAQQIRKIIENEYKKTKNKIEELL